MAKSGPIEPAYKGDRVMQPRSLEGDATSQTEAAGKVNRKGSRVNRKGDNGIFDESIAYDND
jgi:hypothetical protein